MIRSFRLRLTAWYLVFFTPVFVLLGFFLYRLVARALYDQLDDTLLSESKTAIGLFQDELEESKGEIAPAAREAVSEMRVRGLLVAIFANGRIVASSAPVGQPRLLNVASASGLPAEPGRFETVPVPGTAGIRAVARPFALAGRQFVLLAAEPLDAVADELTVVRRMFFFTLPLTMLIVGLGGFWLATRSLAPVRRLAGQAKAMTGAKLDVRLDPGTASQELRLLADAFNELLSRLDRSVAGMRRFVADASHELRTPLSIIRGEADVALAADRSAAEYRQSISVMHDEARRLSRLVDDLLNLTRADSESYRLRTEPFYLNDLVSECCRSAQPAAASQEIGLDCCCRGDLMFAGDQGLLRRLLLNLLENAIRYTPPRGRVSVALETRGDSVRIDVSDTGIGIPPEAAPHVFERFYRADQARSREHGGFGLGLSIVKWIAELHHGKVALSSRPGAGSTFSVLLPKRPELTEAVGTPIALKNTRKG